MWRAAAPMALPYLFLYLYGCLAIGVVLKSSNALFRLDVEPVSVAFEPEYLVCLGDGLLQSA
jgi:hypothetical protein